MELKNGHVVKIYDTEGFACIYFICCERTKNTKVWTLINREGIVCLKIKKEKNEKLKTADIGNCTVVGYGLFEFLKTN